MIRVLHLLIAVGLIIVSVFFLNENVSTLFELNATYIIVRGFMTLWAMFGLFFLGLSVLIMSIFTKESWRESRRYSSHTYAITSEECARLEIMNR